MILLRTCVVTCSSSIFVHRYIANQNRLFDINDNSLRHYINLRNL